MLVNLHWVSFGLIFPIGVFLMLALILWITSIGGYSREEERMNASMRERISPSISWTIFSVLLALIIYIVTPSA